MIPKKDKIILKFECMFNLKDNSIFKEYIEIFFSFIERIIYGVQYQR